LTLTTDWLRRFCWPETLVTGHPLAIAHRGACDHAPENTLKSFQTAANVYAEMWELDVHLSADGVCVVTHDDDLARVAGQDLRVSQSDWKTISALQLPEGQHIPRLEDIIALAQQNGCGLYIDIKTKEAGVVAWRMLQAANFRFACLGSFTVEWIADLRERGCEYTRFPCSFRSALTRWNICMAPRSTSCIFVGDMRQKDPIDCSPMI